MTPHMWFGLSWGSRLHHRRRVDSAVADSLRRVAKG